MIRGQGMPSPRHHDFGNLYVQFDVKFPDPRWTEDPTVFESLRKSLPAPAVTNIPPREAMTEVADLEDMDPIGARAFHGDSNMGDDDEDGERPEGERVQCSAQ